MWPVVLTWRQRGYRAASEDDACRRLVARLGEMRVARIERNGDVVVAYGCSPGLFLPHVNVEFDVRREGDRFVLGVRVPFHRSCRRIVVFTLTLLIAYALGGQLDLETASIILLCGAALLILRSGLLAARLYAQVCRLPDPGR